VRPKANETNPDAFGAPAPAFPADHPYPFHAPNTKLGFLFHLTPETFISIVPANLFVVGCSGQHVKQEPGVTYDVVFKVDDRNVDLLHLSY